MPLHFIDSFSSFIYLHYTVHWLKPIAYKKPIHWFKPIAYKKPIYWFKLISYKKPIDWFKPVHWREPITHNKPIDWIKPSTHSKQDMEWAQSGRQWRSITSEQRLCVQPGDALQAYSNWRCLFQSKQYQVPCSIVNPTHYDVVCVYIDKYQHTWIYF